MGWIFAADVADASRVGWILGNVCGTSAALIMVFLVLSAPAYHHAVPRAVQPWLRKLIQWILWVAPLALFGVWVWGLSRVGLEHLGLYVIAFGAGVLASLAPSVLAYLVTAAGIVGTASAR